MNRKLYSIITAVAILILAGLGSKLLMSQKEPIHKLDHPQKKQHIVKSKTVINDDLTVRVPVSGKVRSLDYYDIYAEVSGTLMNSSPAFREATQYRKGDLILQIDSREAEYNLMAQKSSLLNVITQMLPDLKLDFPESYSSWQDYLTKFHLDSPLDDLPQPGSEKEKYFITLRNVYNLFYTVQSLEIRLGKYKIYAPYDGILTDALITPGTLVRIGQKLGSFINNDAFEIAVTLPMDELDILSIGNKGEFMSADISGQWSAEIIRINEQVDSGTQTVKIFLKVNESSLIDGMYLNGYIESDLIYDVFEVPRKLVSDAGTVFIIDQDKLKEVPVTIVKVMDMTSLVRGLENRSKILDDVIVGAKNGMAVSASGGDDLQ